MPPKKDEHAPAENSGSGAGPFTNLCDLGHRQKSREPDDAVNQSAGAETTPSMDPILEGVQQ
eukprot:1760160-Rhodomonas_salina.1